MNNIFKAFNVTSQREFDNLIESLELDSKDTATLFTVLNEDVSCEYLRKTILETAVTFGNGSYEKLQKQFEMIRNSKAYVEMLRTREQMLRGKVKIAFELLEQDVLDPEAYRQSVCNCMGKIKEIEQEVLKIENLRSVDQDIRDQLRKSENCVDDILSGNRTVSNGEYRELLTTCIDHISVYRERVHVVSSIGDFSLPRVPRDHR